jgi:hypothetical protein
LRKIFKKFKFISSFVLFSVTDFSIQVPHAVKAALVAARELIDKPEDPQAKAKLRGATDGLKNVLGALESALQNKEPAPKEKQDLDKKLAALEALLPKLDKGMRTLCPLLPSSPLPLSPPLSPPLTLSPDPPQRKRTSQRTQGTPD